MGTTNANFFENGNTVNNLYPGQPRSLHASVNVTFLPHETQKPGAACVLFFAGAASAQALASTAPATTYVTPAALFSVQALPAWPPDGSAAAEADLQAVLAAQAQRTPSDVEDALLDTARSPLGWAQQPACQLHASNTRLNALPCIGSFNIHR